MWRPISNFFKGKLGKVAVVLSTFPLWKSLYNFIDAWGNLQMITDYLPRILHFLNTTTGTFVIMGIGFALLALHLFRQSKQPTNEVRTQDSSSATNQPTHDNLNAEHTKTVEQLYDRIRDLEGKKTALETKRKKDVKTIEQYKRDIERLQEHATTQDVRISVRDSELNTLKTQYKWLHEIANTQAKNISEYVVVEKVYFCYQELHTPMLKSVFGINYRNKSVFDISIEKTVSGYIEFEGTKLDAPPLIINDLDATGIGRIGTITIEQRLTRPEADLIASKDPKLAEFNLTNLIITIKGERLATRQPQYLKIPNKSCKM